MEEREEKDIRCECGKLLARVHDDGKIMVWCKHCKKEVGLEVEPHGIVWDGDWMQGATYYEEEKAFYFDDLYESDVIKNASHWMPFPEPPESEAEI